MKNRQPYKIERIMQIYNILQIICNFYVFCLVSPVMFSTDLLIFGLLRRRKRGISCLIVKLLGLIENIKKLIFKEKWLQKFCIFCKPLNTRFNSK